MFMYLFLRKAPRSGLQMENENLKNIIEQYKRSVKSLDDEIELHKLNQSAHDKMIQKEKQYVSYLPPHTSTVVGFHYCAYLA